MANDKEETAPLPENIEIERVVDGDETKTFRVKTTIFRLDRGVFSTIRPTISTDYGDPVPVYSPESKHVIGYADIFCEGNEACAELFLDYHSPERLTIETQSRPLYASVCGRLNWTNFTPNAPSQTLIVTMLIVSPMRPSEDAEPLKCD